MTTAIPTHIDPGARSSPFAARKFWNHPGEAVFGPIWAGSWAVGAYTAVSGAIELFQAWKDPAALPERIAEAVKKAFVGLVSLCGQTASIAYWAHEIRIVRLGRYAQAAEGLSYGSTLISSGLDGAWNLYSAWKEKEAIEHGKTPEERDRHRKQLFLQMLNTASNAAMLAWAALGLATIAFGIALGPVAAGISFTLLAGSLAIAIFSSVMEESLKPNPMIRLP